MFMSTNEALDQINFSRIRSYMTLVNWCWMDSDGDKHIPNISELQRTACNLLAEVERSKNEASMAASGGFVAMKVKYVDGTTRYQVMFDISWTPQFHSL